MRYEHILEVLETRLSSKRFEHSVRVSQQAVRLAEQFGGEIHQARLAGILHDCAREIPNNYLVQKAEALGIVPDSVERSQPVLLHAPLGAKLAQLNYGVIDAAVLQAIVWHTTGGPDMTLLDKIIYVADCIEPGRSFPGVDKLRLLAETDLEATLLAAYNHSIAYMLAEHELIHTSTIEGRNALLLQRNK
jgi:predicted HD superfamily hydrolase involved in NAD metabolism